MGQPTQRATNYTARSNIVTAQIFLHANGQRPKRAMIRQRSRRRQRRGEPHTEHGLGVQHISHSHSGIDEKRPTEKFVKRNTQLVIADAVHCRNGCNRRRPFDIPPPDGVRPRSDWEPAQRFTRGVSAI